MKYAAIINYNEDKEAIRSRSREHHNYLKSFLDNGQLAAVGPMTDDRGALWVLEVDTLENAAAIIQAEPYNVAGLFVEWQIHPLQYWSAKALKGA